MENPIRMDDLGVPLFLETPKCLVWVEVFFWVDWKSANVSVYTACYTFYK